MANINYTATADLKSFSTWLTNNVDQNASTWDSTTHEGVLVLNSGVTEIGGGAFVNCTSLTSITIPSSVTSIEREVFAYCYSLTSITIPSSVTSIGMGAFNSCTSLTSITIPSSVTSIERKAFAKCTSLASITVDSNNSVYDSRNNCNAIIKTNTNTLVFGCKNSTIPSSVTSIGEGAFYDCTSLTSIVIPNSVVSIGNDAFYDCTSLTSITIPSSVTSIGGQAFYGCTSLASITVDSNNSVYDSRNNCNAIIKTNTNTLVFGCKNSTIPSSVTSIERVAFANCTSLASITIPSSVTSIEREAFANCSNLTSVTCKATTPPTLGSNNFTASGDTLYVPSASVSAYQNNTSWSAAFTTIEAIPVTIHYTATSDLKSYSTWLTNNVDQNASTWDSSTGEGVLMLNNGVTEIGQSAFFNCSTITKVTIGEGITSISGNAFNGAQNLTFTELPSTLTNLGNTAFWNNHNLNVVYCKALVPPTMSGSNFSYTDGILFVPSSVVNDYKNSTWTSRFSAIYPYNGNGVITYHSSADLSNYSTWIINNAISTTYDSTTQIGTIEVSPYEVGKEAFKNCSTLTEVSFTNIIIINTQPFSGCTSLTSVTLPDSLTTIGQQVFYGCTGLTQLTIPSSVTTLYRNSFQNTGWWNNQQDTVLYKDSWCLGYKSTRTTGALTINTCEKIANSAFNGCTGLTEITLPDSVTSIGQSAFSGCTGLTSVTFGESLTTIGQQAFQNCTGLTQLTLPDSLTTISNQAFYDCTGLTSVTFGESLTTIGQTAFYICTSLTTIYWNAINVTSYNGYNNVFGGSTPINTIVFGDSVTNIPNNAFNGCTGLTEINFPDSLTTIGQSAFNSCTGLTEITLPESLTIIGQSAFSGCTGLTEINFPDSLTTIGNYAFQNCTGLTSVTFGESLTTIGDSAFAYCSSLTTIYWNAINITSVLSNWHYNCPIDTVVFGDSVTNIPNNALRECADLTSVTLPDSVTSIGQSAFSSCTGLTEINFPDSLTTIGNYAFQNCTGLTSVTFGESLTTIENYAFQNCTNLLSVTCLATKPPTLGIYNFTTSNDTLYVLSSSKAAYQTNYNWSSAFTNIEGIYIVTTSTDGNGTITPTELVVEGESFTVTATPNAHYKVSHFIVDGVDVGTIDNYTFQNLDADHTVHVDFELITHTITATAFEGGAIVPSGTITITDGDDVTFDIIPLEGYGILALFIDGTQIDPAPAYTFENVTTDYTIQALFYKLRSNGFNRDEMLDIDFILQDYLEQLRKRD